MRDGNSSRFSPAPRPRLRHASTRWSN